uniref:Large ribosomal subunit protein mL54 n=1 Tax=Corethrella appendiculata TaxID=1370023 RepID=U5ERY2_9DIPT
MIILNILNKSNLLTNSFNYFNVIRNYAKPVAGGLGSKKKKLGKLGPVVEKKVLPVETDPHKLVNYVCGSNIYKTGEDIKLKSDSEYPDWLWDIHVGKPLTLEDLDPNTKQYWRKLRKTALRRNNQMLKLKKF